MKKEDTTFGPEKGCEHLNHFGEVCRALWGSE